MQISLDVNLSSPNAAANTGSASSSATAPWLQLRADYNASLLSVRAAVNLSGTTVPLNVSAPRLDVTLRRETGGGSVETLAVAADAVQLGARGLDAAAAGATPCASLAPGGGNGGGALWCVAVSVSLAQAPELGRFLDDALNSRRVRCGVVVVLALARSRGSSESPCGRLTFQ